MLESSLLPAPLLCESAVHISVFGKRRALCLPLSRELCGAAWTPAVEGEGPEEARMLMVRAKEYPMQKCPLFLHSIDTLP